MSPKPKAPAGPDIGSLLSAGAVRRRCHQVGEIAQAGNAHWFAIDEVCFKRCVVKVAEVCRQRYPDLRIPLHSRWRHLAGNEVNFWQRYTDGFTGDGAALARTAADLVFLSVILDAGAGDAWRYVDPVSNRTFTRSEGLAAASAELFFHRVTEFSGDTGWRLSAGALAELDQDVLAEHFQVRRDNPLVGLEGRLELLKRLSRVMAEADGGFAKAGRPADIIDECMRLSRRSLLTRKQVDAEKVLEALLRRYAGIWPNGYTHDGVFLGDCGYHSVLDTGDGLEGIVPFHKLSQWLAYSLVEPLGMAGLDVVNLDGLTGLPEYRNGGLFIDTGVLMPLDREIMESTYPVDAEVIVEWRALTVYLLDRLTDELRRHLKRKARSLPLGAVLQGGTWHAGREVAYRFRPDGSPPLKIQSCGTAF